MNEIETLYVATREEWRAWLAGHFRSKGEIWLVYPKKATERPRIDYNTAVEEALCFGWIDSTVKSLDEQNTIQRFCPRRPNSTFSQANKERARWLFTHGRIHASVKEALEPVVFQEYRFPPDIMAAINSDAVAWENYRKFSEPYKRIRIAYIDAARRRPDEFKKRLRNFIEQTRKSKLIKVRIPAESCHPFRRKPATDSG